MYVQILHWWDSLRNSYWFIPALLAAFSCVLSAAVFYLQIRVTSSYFPIWLQATPDSARAVLSAIVSAMVTVTGTVFSITVVVLSLTSQQFGPRLLRNFMHDFTTQLTLGTFLATALYSLISLYAIRGQPGSISVPHLSVIVSFLFMFGSTGMLIVFIHHIAMMIQAPYIVEAVATDLQSAITRLYPEQLGESAEGTEDIEQDGLHAWKEAAARCNFVPVFSTREGYVQALNSTAVLELATRQDLLIQFHIRPGDFVSEGEELARVSLPADPEEIQRMLNDTIVTGRRRTPRQDLECTVSELVEVAVRALSPGINDPTTAVQCVDRLTAALRKLIDRKLPSPYRFDDDGRIRLFVRATLFGPVLDAAYSEIRQYGASSVAVTIRLLEGLCSLARVAVREEDRAAIARHGAMLRRAAEKFPEEMDVKDALERYTTLREFLDTPQAAARGPDGSSIYRAGHSVT